MQVMPGGPPEPGDHDGEEAESSFEHLGAAEVLRAAEKQDVDPVSVVLAGEGDSDSDGYDGPPANA